MKRKDVVASWSGGIDSTAVLGHLAQRGYFIKAVVLDIYAEKMPNFAARERKARYELAPIINQVAQRAGGDLEVLAYNSASWIWAFSRDGIEIPRRNKYVLDFMIEQVAIPRGITNIAMGEYTGADTWLVRDHVGAGDADHRALSAYLFLEYGLSYRLISLQDFGESRYKSDRLGLGFGALADAMHLTTNCMSDLEKHCGKCYKCVERHAAFVTRKIEDKTDYIADPEDEERFDLYLRQMQGEEVTANVHVHKEVL